jgi:hypothetical protein
LGIKTKVDGFLFWASKPIGRRFVGLYVKTDE